MWADLIMHIEITIERQEILVFFVPVIEKTGTQEVQSQLSHNFVNMGACLCCAVEPVHVDEELSQPQTREQEDLPQPQPREHEDQGQVAV
jgi:hypothetical protein